MNARKDHFNILSYKIPHFDIYILLISIRYFYYLSPIHETNKDHTTISKTLSSQVKMAERELMLLGMWSSPYAIKVRMILEQKGLNYEYLEQELFSTKSELLLKSNPIYKKVPVLIHDGRSICESSVILHYIDETWFSTSPPVLPADPYERSMARFWAQFIEDKVLKLPIIVLSRSTIIYMSLSSLTFIINFMRLVINYECLCSFMSL
jgi:Glutathione S-transferase, N-terminal domain